MSTGERYHPGSTEGLEWGTLAPVHLASALNYKPSSVIACPVNNMFSISGLNTYHCLALLPEVFPFPFKSLVVTTLQDQCCVPVSLCDNIMWILRSRETVMTSLDWIVSEAFFFLPLNSNFYECVPVCTVWDESC